MSQGKRGGFLNRFQLIWKSGPTGRGYEAFRSDFGFFESSTPEQSLDHLLLRRNVLRNFRLHIGECMLFCSLARFRRNIQCLSMSRWRARRICAFKQVGLFLNEWLPRAKEMPRTARNFLTELLSHDNVCANDIIRIREWLQ